MQPLPQTNPEFTLIEGPGFHEFRVENWHLARDGSGRILSTGRLTWTDFLFPLIFAGVYSKLESVTRNTVLGCLVLIYLWRRCHIQSESVVILPPHGLQLETHYGLFSWNCFTSRRFIALTMLQDVVINEGLSGWNVRYYLANVTKTASNSFAIDVAYQNILPRFPVLLEVYTAVQTILFKTE